MKCSNPVDIWGFSNKFWHYYNFSYPFPLWIPRLRALINFLQLLPILFGWIISLNRESNNLIHSLSEVSRYIIFLEFSKLTVTTSFLFIISVLMTIIYFVGFIVDNLVLNVYYLAIIHFLFDEILPCLVFMTFPILVYSIREYLAESLELSFLIFQSISCFILLSFYTIKTFYQAKVLIVSIDYFAPWNYWTMYFKNTFGTMIILTILIKDKFIMHNAYNSFCALYSLISLYFDFNQAYVQPVVNILQFSLDTSFLFTSILSLISFHISSFKDQFYLVVAFFVLILSIIISIKLYNHMSEKYDNKIKGGKILHVEKISTEYIHEDHDQNPNSPNGNNNKKNNSNNSSSSNNVSMYQYNEELANNRISIDIMRQRSIIYPKETLLFAQFLMNNSTDPVIISEAMRFIILLQCTETTILMRILEFDPSSFPYWCRQLICDAQFYVISINMSTPAIESYLKDLYVTSMKISYCIISLLEDILMDSNYQTHIKLPIYTSLCDQFEKQALSAMMHTPNSPQLSKYMAYYYINLRGDYMQGQAWTQRTEIIESSSILGEQLNSIRLTIASFKSRMLNTPPMPKQNNILTQNKLKSQEAISKVHSKAISNSVIVFVFISLISIFIIVYSLELPNFEICFSKKTVVSLQSLSRSLFTPIELIAKFSLRIITQNADKYQFLYPSPSDIYFALQNITSMLTSISHDEQLANDIYDLWSKPYQNNKLSCQYLLLQLKGLIDLMPYGSLNNVTIPFMIDYLQIYNGTFTPLNVLYRTLIDFMQGISVRQNYFSMIFSYLVCSVLLLLISLLIFYLTYSITHEKNDFWRVFIEVDETSIELLQTSLQNNPFQKDKTQNYHDQENMLDDDEVDLSEKEKDRKTILLSATIAISNALEQINLSFFSPKRISAFIFYSILFIILAIVAFTGYNMASHSWVMKSLKTSAVERVVITAILNITNYATGCISTIVLQNDPEYNNYNFSYTQNTLYFDIDDLFESINPNNELKVIINEIDKISNLINGNSTKWVENGMKVDDYFESIIDLAFNNTAPVYNNLIQWRLKQFNHHNQIVHSIRLSLSFIIAILFSFYLVVYIIFIMQYYKEFQSLKSILLLLPSPYFSTITNLIHKMRPDKNREANTLDFLKVQSRYIVKQSPDAIIIINSKNKIVDVNKSTEDLTGRKKDELIGSDLENVILKEDKGKSEIYGNLFRQLVFGNAISDSYNQKFNQICRYIDGTQIPISCSIIPIPHSNDDTDAPTYAIVFFDMTFYLEQEKELQEAKKGIESLLFRILPRVMAIKLLSHSQKLHSKVDKAVIVFIGIANFLQWCKDKTHTEIMEQLDIIVSMFDQNISKFPTLVKLKVINGTYMAAGGLFNEVSSKSYSQEMVEFSIMCAHSMAIRNAQVGSKFQLTIGINYGGPIIAGILGSDKPLFDIWGDAVNISSRLQTSCPYNHIQMSKETVDALPPGMFDIKERGEVFLKGKGYQSTYIISLEDILK
ncbi:hypothetical protein TRFO_28104 [Tritrichomonas foetus]|uniref:adenylate cyclase n=1 Tax=Tritrichomonas foetus TaxID=1144522 RepID=A0A1J4K3P7_9EUKA|nr:hypothetical protein TRFO_28104 [Tritrichomonas foetus]|eukprot:OHT04350.1 hypothetical protein TRFO_28104 [Tritrichomonas foetus]